VNRTGALVIHHHHYPRVLDTVGSIAAQLLPDDHLLVVDNSEDPGLAKALRASLPEGVELVITANAGYGAAANLGISHLLSRCPDLDYILVSTHEAIPRAGALAALKSALDGDSTLAAAGPTLITPQLNSEVSRYWSQGGILTRVLNNPRHVAHLEALNIEASLATTPRDWLDGAFCLYRADVVARMPFAIEFFLYFEETDLHCRMRKAGHSIAWIPSAVVEQSSAGIPPYYLGRNLQLFQSRNGNRVQRLITVPTALLRAGAAWALGRRDRADVALALRGWMDSFR